MLGHSMQGFTVGVGTHNAKRFFSKTFVIKKILNIDTNNPRLLSNLKFFLKEIMYK